ncbi:MAG: hypothetical protein V1798_11435 [Pseudomonadota bacterium]
MSAREDFGAAAAVGLLRGGFQLLLWGLGYRVLTVDDYLRTAVAAAMPNHWQWFPDPFFLPAYFWIYSIPYRLGFSVSAGSIGATVLLACASSALLYLLLRKLELPAGHAFLGALLFSAQPMCLWLGGVPLSETLGLVLLLTVLWLWDSPSRALRFAAVAALALVTLVRYESWLYAIFFAGIVLGDRRFGFPERILRSVGALSGFVVFALWRLSGPDPWGPLLFSQDTAVQYLTPRVQLGHVIAGGIALLPLGFLALVAAILFGRYWVPGVRRAPLLIAWSLWSLANLFLPLISIGYYPMVFPVRSLLTGAVLFWLLSFPSLSRILARLSPAMLAAVGIGGIAVLAPLSFRPLPEVKEETLSAARVLGSVLPELGASTLLLERRDLGWTVLWGLNNGDRRIIFDRRDFDVPSPLATVEGAMTFFAAHPEAACVLTASREGRNAAAAVRPEWTPKWSDGKYTLSCVPGFTKTAANAAR